MKWLVVVIILLMSSCKTVTHTTSEVKSVMVLDTLAVYDSTSVRMMTIDSVHYVIKERLVERERGRNIVLRDTIRIVTQKQNTIKEKISYLNYILPFFLVMILIWFIRLK